MIWARLGVPLAIPAIRRLFACGISASVVFGRWGIVLDRLLPTPQLSPKQSYIFRTNEPLAKESAPRSTQEILIR